MLNSEMLKLLDKDTLAKLEKAKVSYEKAEKEKGQIMKAETEKINAFVSSLKVIKDFRVVDGQILTRKTGTGTKSESKDFHINGTLCQNVNGFLRENDLLTAGALSVSKPTAKKLLEKAGFSVDYEI